MGNDLAFVIESCTLVNGLGSNGEAVIPTFTITALIHGERKSEACAGKNSMDAIVKALRKLTGKDFDLKNIVMGEVQIGDGIQKTATVEILHEGRRYKGDGCGSDHNEAAYYGWGNVLNQLYSP